MSSYKKAIFRKNDLSAFTIVELIVVITVIGILASIAIVGYGDWRKRTTITQLNSDLNGAASAMENYSNFNNTYPAAIPTTFKSSKGVSLSGGSLNSGKTYCIDATSDSQTFSITNYKLIFPGICPAIYYDGYNKTSYPGFGSNISDISGNENHGKSNGGVSYSNDGGGSFSFNGTDGYINTTSQPAIKTGPNNFTIAGMIKPGNQYSRFITPNSNGIDQFVSYDPSGGGYISLGVTEIADVNNRSRSTPAGSVPIDHWTYWAVSINDKNIKMYINGNLVAEYNETINIGDWSGGWFIGQRGNSTFYYKGLIGMIGVYGRSLTNNEISNNFESLRARYNL